MEEVKAQPTTAIVPEVVIPIEKPTPRILIGVPILMWDHRFAISFLNFWTELMMYNHKGRKFQVSYYFAYRRPVQMAQEEIVQHAINCGCTHVLIMDDDIFDFKVQDLFALLDADKDVVGGIMFTGGFPYSMCAFRRYDTDKKVAEMPILKTPARLYEVPPEQRKGVVEVDLIAFAFILMKTSIFAKIPKPWFKCDCTAPTDSYFCDALMDAGIKPCAHFDVWMNHKGITRETQPYWMQIGIIDNQKAYGNEMIVVPPEEAKRVEIVMAQKLVESEQKLKAKAIRDQKFYNKQDGEPIATLVPQAPVETLKGEQNG